VFFFAGSIMERYGQFRARQSRINEVSMTPDKTETPFGSIEGAHEYVSLLSQALEEARDSIQEDVAKARDTGATRRLDALKIVAYKLDRLEDHLIAARRLLNDLRTLRRLLLEERSDVPEKTNMEDDDWN
jgi:hypothetical protein